MCIWPDIKALFSLFHSLMRFNRKTKIVDCLQFAGAVWCYRSIDKPRFMTVIFVSVAPKPYFFSLLLLFVNILTFLLLFRIYIILAVYIFVRTFVRLSCRNEKYFIRHMEFSCCLFKKICIVVEWWNNGARTRSKWFKLVLSVVGRSGVRSNPIPCLFMCVCIYVCVFM